MTQRVFNRRNFATLAMSLIPLAFGGCGSGDGKAKISGTVSFDGQPIPEGYITFTPQGTGAPDAGQNKDGKFTLRAIPGKHRIQVEASRPKGPIIPSMGVALREEYIPARYNSESTLSEEVKSGGNNVFEFNLTSQKE